MTCLSSGIFLSSRFFRTPLSVVISENQRNETKYFGNLDLWLRYCFNYISSELYNFFNV